MSWITITSILSGVFIGAAFLLLYISMRDRKSATCSDDNCKCKTDE